ncbi:unnamed protein product [Paramecium sonneborni]|uniref:Uncharacterized protein n=1 Tax=Paramecium sonneborni TaxID=65129 RepID=A0A8S1M3C3_9CILI|nr:unnamed protein product [Paramecium sonneborni]
MKRKNISKKKAENFINKKQPIKKEVGKPTGIIKATQEIELPKIWSCLNIEKQLIFFFISIGRHVSLHLAGTNKSQNNEEDDKFKEKQQKIEAIQQSKSTYEYLQQIAQSLFDWKCTKLNVVYFFRNNYNFKLGYEKMTLINNQWNSIMKNIKFLLNENFYYEFIGILRMFEQNYSNIQIVDQLIKQSQQLDQVPQLVQNFFILLHKQKIIVSQGQITTCTQLENLKKVYLNSLIEHKQFLCEIIENIRTIMYQKQNQDSQYIFEEEQKERVFDDNNNNPDIYFQDFQMEQFY